MVSPPVRSVLHNVFDIVRSPLATRTPGGKVAEGYANLTKEVLKLEKQREKSRAGIGR